MNSIRLIYAFMVGFIYGVILGVLTFLYGKYGLMVAFVLTLATVFEIFLGYIFVKYVIEGLFMGE